MDVRTDCFVSRPFAVVLYLSRLAGIAPLHFVKNKTGWRVSLSTGWSIYGYCIVILTIFMLIGLFYLTRYLYQDFVNMRIDTRGILFVANAADMILISGAASCWAPGQMRSMIACLNHVEKIYNELGFQRWSMRSDRFNLFILWTTATVALIIGNFVLTFLSIRSIYTAAFIWNLIFFFFLLTRNMHQMLFTAFTLQVMYCFRTLNDRLRTLLHDNIINSKHSQPKTIRRLALLYASACDVVREVGRCHGLMVLMMMSSYVFYLLSITHFFLKDMVEGKFLYYQNTLVRVISALCLSLYQAANLMMIIEPCHLTHTEMETTRELVSHLMCYTHSPDDPLAVELQLFVKHLVLNDVSYSPLKITRMSRSLVLTIFGDIITYLVIILKL